MINFRSMPTITVLICNYNHSRYLKRSINSVLEQSMKVDELIIIDDGSTDNSLYIIEEYSANYKNIISYPNKKNIGLIASQNRGLHLATSDFILFLGADDFFDKLYLEKVKVGLSFYPNAGVAMSNYCVVDENGKTIINNALPSISDRSIYFSGHDWEKISIKHGIVHNGNCAYNVEYLKILNGIQDKIGDSVISLILGLRYGVWLTPEVLNYFTYNSKSNFKLDINSFDEVIFRHNLQIKFLESNTVATVPSAILKVYSNNYLTQYIDQVLIDHLLYLNKSEVRLTSLVVSSIGHFFSLVMIRFYFGVYKFLIKSLRIGLKFTYLRFIPFRNKGFYSILRRLLEEFR